MSPRADEVTRTPSFADAAAKPESSTPVFKHDAFISYSRSDEIFASKLEQTLEQYKPPLSLNVPARHLNIFRDKEDFTAGDYHQNLVKNLKDSGKLVVICSPSARGSQYVNEEIRHFVRVRGAEHIIPILFLGIPNNEAVPEQEEKMAFPEALCEVMQMPLAVSYAGFLTNAHRIDRGNFSGAWYMLLANIYEIGRGDIEQRERKRRARSLRIKLAVLAGIILVLPALVIWAVSSIKEGRLQRAQAQVQRQIAEAELTRNQSLLYVSDIILAQQRHREGNVAQAQEILESYLKPGRDNLRGFEWYYLMSQYHNERTTLETDGSGVHAVAFSPDGNTIVSGRSDGVVQLWDVASSKELATLDSQMGDISAIAFSPDGKTFATSGGQVKLWDAASRKELGKFEGHSSIVYAVNFSPDGRTLATASGDKTAKLWDVSSRKELATFEGHKLDVNDVAFSPDGMMLATGSGDATVKLWDIASRKELDTLEQAFGVIRAVAFSPDGKSLAVSGGANTSVVRNLIQLWDVASRKARGIADQTGEINDLTFSPDGQRLVSVSSDSTIKLWDVTSPLPGSDRLPELATLEGHKGNIADVAFSADGKTLATASDDSSVKLWDVTTLEQPPTLNLIIGSVNALSFSPDSKMLAISSDNTVKLWDVATRNDLARLWPHWDYGDVRALAFSPDGKTLAASYGRSAQLWDVESYLGVPTRKEPSTLEQHSMGFTSVAFSADGKKLATGAIDGTVILWDVDLRKELATLKGHEDIVTDVAFSPDGATLVSASHDRTLKLWNTGSHEEIATLKGHAQWVNAGRFSPDGKTIASGSNDGAIKLWDVASHQELATLPGHTKRVAVLTFSADGKTLASGGSDGVVKLWNVAIFKEVVTLEAHTIRLASSFYIPQAPAKDEVLALVFSPDGVTLASGGSDSKVRLWRVPSDVEINFKLHGSK
jgi:WD40 repeat protein